MNIFKLVLNIVGIIVMIGVVVSFAISSYYNFKWLRSASKESYSWIKLGHLCVSIIWVLIYIYVLIKIILGNPVDTNFFGIIIVRPAILLTGVFLAFSSRARFYSLLIEGGKNKCRNPHNNL